MRPPRLLTTALVAVAALAAGCGDDEETTESAAGTTTAKAEQAAFPATIEHKYGSTTVEKAPERVVVVGLREQDALLALDVVPVGTTEWYGKRKGAIFPWAEDELDGRPLPKKLTNTDGIEVEEVAALRPDLIVGIYSGMTKQEYATLSKIAPTIGQVKGKVDYGSTWQEELEMVGRAVGKPDEAAEWKAKTEKLLADARAEHPDFSGKEAAFATPYQGYYVYGKQDARSALLESLGFTFPKSLTDIGNGEEFGGALSGEKLDLLDIDAVVWFATKDAEAKVKKDPVYRKLKVRTEGRDVFIDEQGEFYESTSFVSPLSMPTILEGLVPRLEAAVDGDPETVFEGAGAS